MSSSICNRVAVTPFDPEVFQSPVKFSPVREFSEDARRLYAVSQFTEAQGEDLVGLITQDLQFGDLGGDAKDLCLERIEGVVSSLGQSNRGAISLGNQKKSPLFGEIKDSMELPECFNVDLPPQYFEKTCEFTRDGEVLFYVGEVYQCAPTEAPVFHGTGRIYYPDGHSYLGFFELGNRHGVGQYYDRAGNLIRTALFENDRELLPSVPYQDNDEE